MHQVIRQPEKDRLLQGLLQTLSSRGIARGWAKSPEPFSKLLRECRILISDPACEETFRTYLQANPIIQQTVETLLAHYAMASSAEWQDVPALLQPLARRGWHIGRWVPTFLIIDGPLGRFLKAPDSPLNALLRGEYAKYPTLAQARDIFNNDLFRQVRNGVGHWSFLWQEGATGPSLVMVDWKSVKTTATITLLEAEALHLVGFSVIEALDQEVFSRVNPRGSGG
jgi:hypothetical protein